MWTAKTIGIMKDLLAKGYTARRIAQELGPSFTRAAVIGKWNRMGLSPPGFIYTTKRSSTIPTRKDPPDVTTVTYTDFSPPQHILFDDLTHDTCRYPISGEGRRMLFCGDPTTNRIYCEHHQKLTRVSGSTTNYMRLLKKELKGPKSAFRF